MNLASLADCLPSWSRLLVQQSRGIFGYLVEGLQAAAPSLSLGPRPPKKDSADKARAHDYEVPPVAAAGELEGEGKGEGVPGSCQGSGAEASEKEGDSEKNEGVKGGRAPMMAAVALAEASIEAKLHAELYASFPEDAGRAASESDAERNAARETEHEVDEESDEGGDHKLTYGEVIHSTFVVSILERIAWHGGLGKEAKVFTDIGCGAGKPIFSAALYHPFELVRGIEILGNLVDLVSLVKDVYRSKIQIQLPEYDKRRRTVIEIKKGDAFSSSGDCGWADSDLVFSNSTCFTKAMWKDYSDMTQHLKPGSFVVTTTIRFRSTPWLECVEASRLRQEWGSCGLFIHRRLPEGVSDPRKGLDPKEFAELQGSAPDAWPWDSDDESDDISDASTDEASDHASTTSDGSDSTHSELFDDEVAGLVRDLHNKVLEHARLSAQLESQAEHF